MDPDFDLQQNDSGSFFCSGNKDPYEHYYGLEGEISRKAQRDAELRKDKEDKEWRNWTVLNPFYLLPSTKIIPVKRPTPTTVSIDASVFPEDQKKRVIEKSVRYPNDSDCIRVRIREKSKEPQQEATPSDWFEIVDGYCAGKPFQSNDIIVAAWKQSLNSFVSFPIDGPLSFATFIDKSPHLAEIADLVMRNPIDEDNTFYLDKALLSAEEMSELKCYAIACSLYMRATQKKSNALFFLVQAYLSIPATTRKPIWELICEQIKKHPLAISRNPESLEAILNCLLIDHHYSLETILTIIQSIGMLRLIFPDNKNQGDFSTESKGYERVLRVGLNKETSWIVPFSWNTPADIAKVTKSWTANMPAQNELKALFDYFIKDFSADVKPCEQMKALFKSKNIQSNQWPYNCFELMSHTNPFVVFLGYSLFFAERSINPDTKVTMVMTAYLGRYPLFFNYLPVSNPGNRLNYYRPLVPHAGSNAMVGHLNQFTGMINWENNNLTNGEILCQLINHILNIPSLRQAAWQMWFHVPVTTSMTADWTESLRRLVSQSDMLNKDKNYLTAIVELLNREEKILSAPRAANLYSIILPFVKDDPKLHLQVVHDILNILNKTRKEYLAADEILQFVAKILNTLLKEEHVKLCKTLLNAVLEPKSVVTETTLAEAIANLCELMKTADFDRAYALWKQVENSLRVQKEKAPDIDFIISAARRHYQAVVRAGSPPSELGRLTTLLERSNTVKISAAELRKFKLAVNTDVQANDFEIAAEIIKDAKSSNNQTLSFKLQCKAFELRWRRATSAEDLEGLLPSFFEIIDMGNLSTDIEKIQRLYTGYFEAACSKKMLSLIVLDRLINDARITDTYALSFNKRNLQALLKIIPQANRSQQDGLLKLMSHVIAVVVMYRQEEAIDTLLDAFLTLEIHEHPNILEQLRKAALWLSQKVKNKKRDLLNLLIRNDLKGFDEALLKIWIPVLQGYLLNEFGREILSLLETLRAADVLSHRVPSLQLDLIRTLISQLLEAPESSFPVNVWVNHFCALNPDQGYVDANRTRILEWIAALLKRNDVESALALIRLLEETNNNQLMNQVLNIYFDKQQYTRWLTTIVKHKECFPTIASINHYSARITLILPTIRKLAIEDRTSTMSLLLQLAERYSLSSVANWANVLLMIKNMGNNSKVKKMKAEVLRIISQKKADNDQFSHDLVHGLTCWSIIVDIAQDVKGDYEWITSQHLLEQPFLNDGINLVRPFLLNLLALFLRQSNKALSTQQTRLKRAFAIHQHIVRERPIPQAHRLQMAILIDQAVGSKCPELYSMACDLAHSLVVNKDRESLEAAKQSIQQIYSQARAYRNPQDPANDPVVLSMERLSRALFAAEIPLPVNLYQISKDLANVDLCGDSLNLLSRALKNQKNLSFDDQCKIKDNFDPYIEKLTNIDLSHQVELQPHYWNILLECLLDGQVEKLSSNPASLKILREVTICRILNIMPTAISRVHLVPLRELSERVLGSYVKHLKTCTIDDDPVSSKTLEMVIHHLGLYVEVDPEFFCKNFRALEEILFNHIKRNCQLYTQLLDAAIECVISSDGYGRSESPTEVIRMHVRRFQKTAAPLKTKLELVASFAYNLQQNIRNQDDHDRHLKNIRDMILDVTDPVEDKTGDGIYLSLRLYSHVSEGDIHKAESITVQSLKKVLGNAILPALSTRNPFGINRALTLLKRHCSDVGTIDFREEYLKHVLAACSTLKLSMPLFQDNFKLFNLILVEFSIASPAMDVNLPAEARDTQILASLAILEKILKNSVINPLEQSDMLEGLYFTSLDSLRFCHNDMTFLASTNIIMGDLFRNHLYFTNSSRFRLMEQIIRSLRARDYNAANPNLKLIQNSLKIQLEHFASSFMNQNSRETMKLKVLTKLLFVSEPAVSNSSTLLEELPFFPNNTD